MGKGSEPVTGYLHNNLAKKRETKMNYLQKSCEHTLWKTVEHDHDTDQQTKTF